MEKFYNNNKSGNGILFDGYPRNVKQAKHLLKVIQEDDSNVDLVIYLKVPKEELLKRATKRAEVENRADDKDVEIVLNRINEFGNSTIPAIEFIKKAGVKTVEIDGDQSIANIFVRISVEIK